MTDWTPVFLAIIAVSTLVMALIQVGAIVLAARLGAQVQRVLASVQRDIPPLVTRANAIADEASKTAALATAQAEKVDRLVTDLARRVDETAAVVQAAVITPAREGLALVAALKAGLGALRGGRDFRGRSSRSEDEDALFIG